MNGIEKLFHDELKVVNIGPEKFKNDLDSQDTKAVQLDWKPPAGGDPELIQVLDKLSSMGQAIELANQEAVSRIRDAHPFLIGIEPALSVIPGMHERMILHSGPPIDWSRMSGPTKGAIIGALIYEGMAATQEEAEELARSGDLEFSPANEHAAVGPMAGVISPSMPVHIIENKVHGNRAYCTVNEGLGKVLRFGANSPDVIERLKWIETVFAPALRQALRLTEGIDVKGLTAQALHMGDECHNRNKAATSLFLREVLDLFLQTDLNKAELREVVGFIRKNEHYFLNLSMPACKAALDAASGIPGSTIVTTMSRNGTDFGIRISGLGENEWFTAPANYVEGLMFPGFTKEDAARDLGDSAITETMGIGGFAMAASPAIVQFVGGSVDRAIAYSQQMYEITQGENSSFTLPTLDFRGTATGIDIRKVVEKNILPVINTGMAHKEAGIGQVGAGIVHPPLDCFKKALLGYADRYRETSQEQAE